MFDEEESESFRDIGESLVEYASHRERFGRGMVTELFPYIFLAAKRLSTRAISDYLRENHQVRLSAASVAKALREPQKHLRALADKYEPLGRIVADAHEMNCIEILESEPADFEGITHEPPALRPDESDESHDRFEEYDNAKSVLEREWFALDSAVRAMVLKTIEDSDQDSSEPTANPGGKGNDR